MSQHTEIAWTDSTFNPWWGCTKVGPGCDHCYAETLDARFGGAHWGPGAARRRTSVHNWNDPVRWNKREFFQCNACGTRGFGVPYEDFNQVTAGKLNDGHACAACGSRDMEPTRQRVFCASMGDVFDNTVPEQWRADLFALIRKTPNLDWLLLTKRIGNAQAMIDEALADTDIGHDVGFSAWPWPNVWLGATICNQEEVDRDIPKLLAVPAAKRFLSMEPLLGPVNLERPRPGPDLDQGSGQMICQPWLIQSGIDWVIVGGESGPGARPVHPDWVRSLRDQCQQAGVPLFFKQWGQYLPVETDVAEDEGYIVWAIEGCGELLECRHKIIDAHEQSFAAVGKKAAGRLLDGRTWDEVPS